MSIAEFFLENFIDPFDPDGMNTFLENAFHYDYDDDEEEPAPPVERVGMAAAVQEQVRRDAASRTAASSWPLNESELDYMAETRGWEKVYGLPAQPAMASYRNDAGDARLNFWLSTGTVGSYLNHPRQGKTQLFRRQVGTAEAVQLFHNPRQHTGKGYHTTDQKPRVHSASAKRKASIKSTRTHKCSACQESKPSEAFSKNQRNKGTAARCRSCIG